MIRHHGGIKETEVHTAVFLPVQFQALPQHRLGQRHIVLGHFEDHVHLLLFLRKGFLRVFSGLLGLIFFFRRGLCRNGFFRLGFGGSFLCGVSRYRGGFAGFCRDGSVRFRFFFRLGLVLQLVAFRRIPDGQEQRLIHSRIAAQPAHQRQLRSAAVKGSLLRNPVGLRQLNTQVHILRCLRFIGEIRNHHRPHGVDFR